jgi:hypothetical protein
VLIVSISGRIQFYSVEHDDPESGSSDVPSSISTDHDSVYCVLPPRRTGGCLLHLDKFEQLSQVS